MGVVYIVIAYQRGLHAKQYSNQNIRIIFLLPSLPRSPKRSLIFTFSNKYFALIHLFHMCLCPSNVLSTWVRFVTTASFHILSHSLFVSKLTVAEQVHSPPFLESDGFVTVFTTARHWSLSCARWFEPTSSHPAFLSTILYRLLYLGLQSFLMFRFSYQDFVFLIPVIQVTCPPNHPCYHTNTLCWGTNYETPLYEIFSIFRLLALSYVQTIFSAPCFQPPMILCFFLRARDQVSHPYNKYNR
jgi:hypothetical protein